MIEYLASLTESGREKIRRDSVNALRDAWPFRNTDKRAKLVIHSNIKMLRTLRTF